MVTAPKSKQSVAKKTVNKVKGAPQKIVEHALNSAINTVEKAAQKDIKRTTKKLDKINKKIEKAQKKLKKAKSDIKTANANSIKINDIKNEKTKSALAPTLKSKVKSKIENIVSTNHKTTFYYDRRQVFILTLMYTIISILVYLISDCLIKVGLFDNWLLFAFLTLTQILILGALASSLFAVTVNPTLAVIDKNGIKIDHNQLLLWKDIDFAEERFSSYTCLKRPFIALHVSPKKLSKYKLTFMQKLCKNNIFTAFSIPLYAMYLDDAVEIREIIKAHCLYKDNTQNQ